MWNLERGGGSGFFLVLENVRTCTSIKNEELNYLPLYQQFISSGQRLRLNFFLIWKFRGCKQRKFVLRLHPSPWIFICSTRIKIYMRHKKVIQNIYIDIITCFSGIIIWDFIYSIKPGPRITKQSNRLKSKFSICLIVWWLKTMKNWKANRMCLYITLLISDKFLK